MRSWRRRIARGRDELTIAVAEMTGWGGVGGIAGGVKGAAAGIGAPIASHLARWTIDDVVNKVLSHSERHRVASVLTYLRAEIEERERAGEHKREDGFFAENVGARSDAEEVFEGVLVAAQREHEERKLPYMARLFAAIAFDPAFDRVTAERLLRLARELSYTQLGLLALIAKRDEHELPNDASRDGTRSYAAEAARAELDDLGYGQRELVFRERKPLDSEPEWPSNVPARIALGPWVRILHDAMGLEEIPFEEREALAALLRECHDGV